LQRKQKEMNVKASVADRVLQRLQVFTKALEGDEKITDRFTCRQIELDLKPTHYTPDMVRAAREALGVSQAVFAKFLGVSLKTVCAWEQGTNPPKDIACRFMDEIRAKPLFWRKRLKEAMRVKGSTADR
jgi:DNA-binding transcriptional regulator YiaG